MTAHFHHAGMTDDLVIDHYLHDDPSTGMVLLRDAEGHTLPDVATALVPWDGDA